MVRFKSINFFISTDGTLHSKVVNMSAKAEAESAFFHFLVKAEVFDFSHLCAL